MHILYILGNIQNGGIESETASIISHLDNTKYCIDIAGNYIDFQSRAYKKMRLCANKIFMYGKYKHEYSLYFSVFSLISIMRNGKYDIVVSNLHCLNGIVLGLAYLQGIKQRISYSHKAWTAAEQKKFSKKLKNIFFVPLKYLTCFFATSRWAVSPEAGRFLYMNHSFMLFYNGIEIERYAFNQKARDAYRKKFHLADNFVIGNVGRLDPSKNQIFLFDILKEMLHRKEKIKLVIVGDGPLRSFLQQAIDKYQLQNTVILLGSDTDVPGILNAFDCFLFPSIVESFGIAALEAQCAGLPCFVSDGIPDIACIVNVTKISLASSAKQWANIILKGTKTFSRKDAKIAIKTAGLDIHDTVKLIDQAFSNCQ